ncbi:MAG: N-acetyl-alpha-D-glucosaminyl L-malate synthase BshA [bacterium]
MRRLRIGIACHPTLGGSGIVATEVGMGLARAGHDVHFVGLERPGRLVDEPGVRFHPVPLEPHAVFAHPPEALALASALAAVAQREALDVIHAHYAVPHAVSAWLALELCGPARPALAVTLHGTDVTGLGRDPAYAPLLRHCLRHADLITAPSKWLADEARRLLGDAARDVEVVPNFVDSQQFRPEEPEDAARLQALFGGGDVPVIAHVSSFRPIKRVDAVLAIFERLRTPARLVLIGDGPDRPAVEAEVVRRGLADRTRLLGRRDHFEALLRACAAFVLPSRSESFGLAALEALASGVPVVAAQVGGLPEVVRAGETGYLVPGDDWDAYAAHLDTLLVDPGHRERMGRAARRDATHRFQPGPVIGRYARLLGAAVERAAADRVRGS